MAEAPEERLRRYRPVGPPPDLKSRVFAPGNPAGAWIWGAAAALVVLTLGMHVLTARTARGMRPEDPPGRSVEAHTMRIERLLTGTEEAARLATLLAMEEEMSKRLPRPASPPAEGRPW